MTKYTVVWHGKAQDDLARLWIETTDRRPLSAAANSIDLELASDALHKGVAIIGELRLLTIAPLQILFAVSEPDRLAKVLHVVGQ
jgi:hypothetical protein